MVDTLCPFCRRHSHFTLRWGRVYEGGNRAAFAATCDACGRLSTSTVSTSYGYYARESVDLAHVRGAISTAEEPLEWLPRAGEAPEVADVPSEIARAAVEAYSSASVGNHMAAILMARTVLEATAKAKDIRTGNLYSKINAMRDANLIRPAIAEQAHEVRFSGNDMAHGDIGVTPDAHDSEEILALMAEVLAEVFQGPARLQRIREKRQTST